jgi:hypothetical protein
MLLHVPLAWTDFSKTLKPRSAQPVLLAANLVLQEKLLDVLLVWMATGKMLRPRSALLAWTSACLVPQPAIVLLVMKDTYLSQAAVCLIVNQDNLIMELDVKTV